MKIDAVITWVNGNDPLHREKRQKYASKDTLEASDKGGDARYSDLGEIFWCVASLNRFAPWLNKIYIVTDNQDPNLEGFVLANFPEGHIPMEIVDHTVIFKDYEQFLPTFNSISIETMTWRIPGLSDRFIEFNDDLMLLNPVFPEDFFTEDGKVVCYGEWSSVIWDRFTRLLKGRSAGQRKVTTKESHMNGAALTGRSLFYIRPAHCQKALRRDVYDEYFKNNPGKLLENVQYRFRDVRQFTPQVMHYMTLYKHGLCDIRSARNKCFFMQPNGDSAYFRKKFMQLKNFMGKFACFNSIDQADDKQLNDLIAWIEKKLTIVFNK